MSKIDEIYGVWTGEYKNMSSFEATKRRFDAFKAEFLAKGYTPEQIVFFYDNFHDFKRVFEWRDHDLYIEYMRAEEI